MKVKAIQYFSDAYLERCKGMKPEQILQFLEDFRTLYGHKTVKEVLLSDKHKNVRL